MTYTVKNNETLSDICLNKTGSINSLYEVLTLNNLSSWTPEVYQGQVLNLPDVLNNEAQRQLTMYPINNYSVSDLNTKLTYISTILDGAIILDYAEPIINEVKNNYTVKENETFSDIVLNSTGTLDNLISMIDGNNLLDYTPVVHSGQQLKISYDYIHSNNLKLLKQYPVCNSPLINNLDSQINEIISKFANVVLFDDDLNIMLFDDDLNTALFN